jgi:hypothetical protein
MRDASLADGNSASDPSTTKYRRDSSVCCTTRSSTQNRVQAFGQTHARRFDLFDPQAPFLQTGDVPLHSNHNPQPVARLLAEIPVATERIHFTHVTDDRHRLCPACCARGVGDGAGVRLFWRAQAYVPSINGVPPIYVLPAGDTLFETLTPLSGQQRLSAARRRSEACRSGDLEQRSTGRWQELRSQRGRLPGESYLSRPPDAALSASRIGVLHELRAPDQRFRCHNAFRDGSLAQQADWRLGGSFCCVPKTVEAEPECRSQTNPSRRRQSYLARVCCVVAGRRCSRSASAHCATAGAPDR